VFFTGAGVIVLAETVLRFLMPDYRARWSWTLIVGSVLLAIGLGTWESLEWVWALVLAAIGVAILRNAILRRRGSDRGGPDVRE
jgi:Na+/alanine symporter